MQLLTPLEIIQNTHFCRHRVKKDLDPWERIISNLGKNSKDVSIVINLLKAWEPAPLSAQARICGRGTEAKRLPRAEEQEDVAGVPRLP